MRNRPPPALFHVKGKWPGIVILAFAAGMLPILLTQPGGPFPDGVRISAPQEQEGVFILDRRGWKEAGWISSEAFPGPEATRIRRGDLEPACIDAAPEARAELERRLRDEPADYFGMRALWVRVVVHRRVGNWPCLGRSGRTHGFGVQLRIIRIVDRPPPGCSTRVYWASNRRCPAAAAGGASGGR